MRKIVIALGALGFALTSIASMDAASAAKEPKKTKMGCIVGKEKWDAGAGKCVPSEPVAKAKKKA